MNPLLLVTNDDGYRADGIIALAQELHGLGDVFLVAPEEEKSAVSHALTIRDPLRVKKISPKVFAVRGTPADCVILAVRSILPRKPDLVVSGINHGRNLGDDVMYSGTVAGAREACYLDLPSFAISGLWVGDKTSFLGAARYARELAGRILKSGLPEGTFLNVNVPSCKRPKGIQITHQGSRLSRASLLQGLDPRGIPFFWIGEDIPTSEWQEEDGSDYQAVRRGYISVTPLHRDQTNYRAMTLMKQNGLDSPSKAKTRKREKHAP